jgi:hypothetical protein
MKTLPSFILVPVIAMILYGCSKTNGIGASVPATVLIPNSTWTVAGNTYSGTGLFSADTILDAGEQNAIKIVFNGTPVAGSYTVVTGNTPDSLLTSTECYVGVFVANKGWSTSVDTSINLVNVTVTAGKITSTFFNIPLSGVSDSTVSGTVVQQ